MKIQGYPRFKAFKDDNSAAVGWKLYSYSAGTSTPLATYTDQTGASANTNPVILDGSGEASVWLDPTQSYKLILTDDADVVQWSEDSINTAESGIFSTVSVSGQITSTVTTGTAPLVISSTTKVGNLNADLLDNGDWAAPGAIGATVASSGSFTTLTASQPFTENDNGVQQTSTGAQTLRGQATEEITLSTVGTTTDSSANLLPVNSIILAVTARVTQVIATATDWKLGDGTTAARFCSANSGLAAGTTAVCMDQMKGGVSTDATGPVQTSAAKLRITTTGTPTSGKIRVTVHYLQFGPPTS